MKTCDTIRDVSRRLGCFCGRIPRNYATKTSRCLHRPRHRECLHRRQGTTGTAHPDDDSTRVLLSQQMNRTVMWLLAANVVVVCWWIRPNWISNGQIIIKIWYILCRCVLNVVVRFGGRYPRGQGCDVGVTLFHRHGRCSIGVRYVGLLLYWRHFNVWHILMLTHHYVKAQHTIPRVSPSSS